MAACVMQPALFRCLSLLFHKNKLLIAFIVAQLISVLGEDLSFALHGEFDLVAVLLPGAFRGCRERLSL